MTSALLSPCPFCGSGTTQIRPQKYWTGMRSEVISVEVLHWCEDRASQITGSSITMRAKTEAEAIEKWNRRVTPETQR